MVSLADDSVICGIGATCGGYWWFSPSARQWIKFAGRGARKRGGLAQFRSLGSEAATEGALLAVEDRVPAPEVMAMKAERRQQLLDCLHDEMLEQIAGLKLDGYTDPEIAKRLGMALRTVERKFELIRKHWRASKQV